MSSYATFFLSFISFHFIFLTKKNRNKLIIGTIHDVSIVSVRERLGIQPDLEVDLPRTQPEEVWIELADLVGDDDRDPVRARDGSDRVVAVPRDLEADVLGSQAHLDLFPARLPLPPFEDVVPDLLRVEPRNVLHDHENVLGAPGIGARRQALGKTPLVFRVLHDHALAQVVDRRGAQEPPPEVQVLVVVVGRSSRYLEFGDVPTRGEDGMEWKVSFSALHRREGRGGKWGEEKK